MNVISSLTAQIQDLPKVFAVSQRYFVGTYDMLFKLLKFLCKSGDYQITGKNKVAGHKIQKVSIQLRETPVSNPKS